MKVAIISEQPINQKHGTGAQLLRMFSNREVDFFHLYFWDMFGSSDCDNSFMLEKPELGSYRGRRMFRRIQALLGLAWWYDDSVNDRLMQELIKRQDLRADVAYIVIGCEASARRSLSLLKYLKCPYVVHVMDFYHPEVVANEMPALRELLSQASKVFVITESIRDQFARFASPSWVEVIRVGQSLLDGVASPPEAEEFRVVMIGRPYREGASLLGEAWPELTRRIPGIKLHYAGAHFNTLPENLKQIAVDEGQIREREKLHTFLRSCHCAFLCGPLVLNDIGLYSFPSRTTDYLMAGLPLVASVAEGSATEIVLEPLIPKAAKIARDPEQIVGAMCAFATDRPAWLYAQTAGRAFAGVHLNIDVIRDRIFAALQQASGAERARTDAVRVPA